jgi:DNA mismatch endonuclease (patch repair protein)
MADVVSKAVRSRIMSRIRGKNTEPELRVRRVVLRMGYRVRLHAANLPGRPDIVLQRHRIAIFVHGCFWHRHQGCSFATRPATRRAFWMAKFRRNMARDRRIAGQLRRSGWSVITIWECMTRDEARLRSSLKVRISRARRLKESRP